MSDTTTFPIGTSGKLYLAAILDLYSRFVVGWAVSAVNDRHLTLNALDQALRRRGPAAGKASINGQSLLPLETTVANGRKLVEIRAPQASRGVFRSPIAP